MTDFFENYESIYGHKTLSYNVHGLLHLAEDCRSFGTINDFTAFKYEDKLHYVKRQVRQFSKPLHCLVYRVDEQDKAQEPVIPKTFPIFSKPHSQEPVTFGTQNLQQFLCVEFAEHKLTTKKRNNVVETDCPY